MGVALTPILEKKTISIDDLRGRVVAVDAYNMLYQFLTTIRTPDGTPLKDSDGNVTSHLVGLYSRVTNLMEKGVKLIFVFDGEKPVLKQREIDRRKQLKEEAAAQYAEAVEQQDVEAMKKFSGRTAHLTTHMALEAKELLGYLGIPVVQAPAEAEAQAARYVREGYAYAVVSQDADCLLFNCPLYIRNLSISGRRKKPGTSLYMTVEPEMISLSDNLAALKLTHEQLITLGMLVGTDFNPGGIHGIGPKKALKLVHEHKTPAEVFAAAAWNEHSLVPWEDVFDLLKNMPTHPPVKPEWKNVNVKAVEAMLGNRGFSKERFAILEKLKNRQQGLTEFL
jgi:flap endonuclease-1